MAERRYMTNTALSPAGPQGPGRIEIDHFMRSYHTLLRSAGEVQLRALTGPYQAMNSALHIGARESALDLSALTYATLRLPSQIAHTRLVLLGQSQAVFRRAGYQDVLAWQRVTAPGRRRLMLYDGDGTLAVLIASPSDVDDLVPMLLAYELEWNKLHTLLGANNGLPVPDEEGAGDPASFLERARPATGLDDAGWNRLAALWGSSLENNLRRVYSGKKHFAVRLLGGSANDYVQVTERWWRHVRDTVLDAGGPNLEVGEAPLYFVSSNTHSLVNLLSGYAMEKQDELIGYIRGRHPDLWQEYEAIRAQKAPSSWENFLYYVAKKYLQEAGNEHQRAERTQLERSRGIVHVTSRHYLDIHAQAIELGKLDQSRLDPRLRLPGLERLRESNALILNIDYPLGWAAYQVLRAVSARQADLRGVYVMGKAATLNGRIGDVMIADHFFDENSGNIYLIENCFTARQVEPYLVYGSVLDHQRAVATYGTFLQSESYMDLLYRDGYTILEAEAGPYLDALYENTLPTRYPIGEVVNLYEAPCEMGFLHYASDTPYTKGQNLGARNLSYAGMDPTYASTLAIARRILEREIARLSDASNGSAAGDLPR